MDGNIPDEVIEEVRARTDITAFVSQYVQLKKTGRNFWGLCPFHSEKTPSFSVAPDKQIFHCFGCGASGNVFSFLMKSEGISFPEAVRVLAGRAGIRLPDVEVSPAAEQRRRQKERLLEAFKLAAGFYQDVLLHTEAGNSARRYLEKRGLSPETVRRFGLGLAPDSWASLKNFLCNKGFAYPELLTAGLLSESEKKTVYDRFRNRIIFPIHNQRGEVIAFGGRVLGEGSPKYLNSPETPLFEKGRNLYALHLAKEAIRRERQAVVFEGYMDVITAHQAGITHAVATLGTALTEIQGRLLQSWAEEVLLVYDADAAGLAATWRGLQVLRQAGCLVKIGRLPAGTDPDGFIAGFGGEAFRERILGTALLLGDWQLQVLAEQHNLQKNDERLRFIDKLTAALLSVENAVERDSYLEKAATLLKVPVETVREELRKKLRPSGRSPSQGQRVVPILPPVTSLTAEERVTVQIFSLLSRFPDLISEVAAEIQMQDFPAELQPVLAEIMRKRENFTPARLHELLPEGRYRQLLGGLLMQEEYEGNIAKRAIQDCVRRYKRLQSARRRKELEEKMAGLDPVSAKGEYNELSRMWLELRKLEEKLNRPGEGGKVLG
ncbi:MAG: DNA primase [Syntrophomonadaceae bacterium]|nr:DNA primase [Bacillota bacterium]